MAIFLVLLSVLLIMYPDESNPKKPTLKLDFEWGSDYGQAIMFGLLTPICLSSSIAVSRYSNTNYGYDSIDMTMDTALVVSFWFLPFLLKYHLETGYSLLYFALGTLANLAVICANLSIYYATSEGLAAPATAVFQCQGILHILLSSVFQGIIPSVTDGLAIACMISGVLVMLLKK